MTFLIKHDFSIKIGQKWPQTCLKRRLMEQVIKSLTMRQFYRKYIRKPTFNKATEIS